MAKKPAKMANRAKGQESGAKVNHYIEGGPVGGYQVFNAAGEPQGEKIEKMWDAIDYRNSLDMAR